MPTFDAGLRLYRCSRNAKTTQINDPTSCVRFFFEKPLDALSLCSSSWARPGIGRVGFPVPSVPRTVVPHRRRSRDGGYLHLDHASRDWVRQFDLSSLRSQLSDGIMRSLPQVREGSIVVLFVFGSNPGTLVSIFVPFCDSSTVRL